MDYRFEIFSLPEEFPFDIYYGKKVEEKGLVLHYHDCLELNFVERDGGYNFIEDNKYELKAGDFYIMNNLDRHYAVTKEDMQMIVIVFNPSIVIKGGFSDNDYLKPFFKRNIRFSNCIKSSEPLSADLVDILYKMKAEWDNKQEGYKLIIRALLLHLLALLFRHFTIKNEISDNTVSFYKSYDRIKNVIDYINANYTEEIRLDILAKKALMNKTYFCSYFKEVTKININDYINELRIKRACLLLDSSKQSISDIALSSGFNSVSYFNRVFKTRIEMSPKEYRKK